MELEEEPVEVANELRDWKSQGDIEDGRLSGSFFLLFNVGQAFGADGNGLTILLQYHTALLSALLLFVIRYAALGNTRTEPSSTGLNER